jgi:hypothetical protein
MYQNAAVAPDHIYTVHPGGGDCGLKGLKKESFCSAKGQYVYRCTCGFRWFLFPTDLRALVQQPSPSDGHS